MSLPSLPPSPPSPPRRTAPTPPAPPSAARPVPRPAGTVPRSLPPGTAPPDPAAARQREGESQRERERERGGGIFTVHRERERERERERDSPPLVTLPLITPILLTAPRHATRIETCRAAAHLYIPPPHISTSRHRTHLQNRGVKPRYKPLICLVAAAMDGVKPPLCLV